MAKALVLLDLATITPLVIAAVIPIAAAFLQMERCRDCEYDPRSLSLLSRGFTGIDAIGQLAGETIEVLFQMLIVAIGALQAVGLTAAQRWSRAPQWLQRRE